MSIYNMKAAFELQPGDVIVQFQNSIVKFVLPLSPDTVEIHLDASKVTGDPDLKIATGKFTGPYFVLPGDRGPVSVAEMAAYNTRIWKQLILAGYMTQATYDMVKGYGYCF